MSRARRSVKAPVMRMHLVLAAKILLSLAVLVSAASITITSSNYQAEIGSSVTVANVLLATDKGFTVASAGVNATGTSCSSPITFGPVTGTANTVIVLGHLVYDVQINSTAGALANTKFNVTFVLAGTAYGPLCIETPSPSVDGQTIDCKYDVGTSLPSSPYTFK